MLVQDKCEEENKNKNFSVVRLSNKSGIQMWKSGSDGEEFGIKMAFKNRTKNIYVFMWFLTKWHPSLKHLVFKWIPNWNGWYLDLHCKVGAQVPNIEIQIPFEIQTFWCSDLGCFGIIMTGSIVKALAAVQTPDHSKMEPVHRNPRWRLFGQIWNGRPVWFCIGTKLC